MSEYTFKEGTFCWVDLASTDPQASKEFYSKLFGWEIFDIPIPGAPDYTMLNIDGKPVAALAEMQPELKEMNSPSFWTSYVAVENIAAIMEKAAQNGGKIAMPAMEVMEEGIMGLIQDPSDAYLGLWQAKNMKGFAFNDIPGSICWFEHGSSDSNKSISFYENTFGWTTEQFPMQENFIYTLYKNNEIPVAGAYSLPPELDNVPSHWLPYFATADINKSIEKIVEMNGEVLMPATMVEGVGTFSVIRDPQGAAFGLLQK